MGARVSRALTSVRSATRHEVGFTLRLTPVDASTTWEFGHRNLVALQPPVWEVPFAGGLGAVGAWRATLSTSAAWVSSYRSVLRGATAELTVRANSDAWQPVRGRVSELGSSLTDDGRLDLTVFDDTLPPSLLVPHALPHAALGFGTIVPHPEVLREDYGAALYYGQQVRPFFFVAADCGMEKLLGPYGVTSAAHDTTSVWFNPNLAEVAMDAYKVSQTQFNRQRPGDEGLLLTTYVWAQQSGATNAASSTERMGVQDYAVGSIDKAFPSQLFEFTGVDERSIYPEKVGAHYEGPGHAGARASSGYFPGPVAGWALYFEVQPRYPLLGVHEFGWTHGAGRFDAGGVVSRHVAALHLTSVASTMASNVLSAIVLIDCAQLLPGDSPRERSGTTNTSGTAASLLLCGSTSLAARTMAVVERFMNPDQPSSLFLQYGSVLFYGTKVELHPKLYRNRSIYGLPVDCANVAVSQHALGVISHLFSAEYGIAYSTSAWAQAQSDFSLSQHSGVRVQAVLDKRRPLRGVVDELARLSGAMLWMGDSGRYHAREYMATSATATVDWTVTASDLLPGSELLDVIYGPSAPRAAQVLLRYDQDLLTGEFRGQQERAAATLGGSDAACNSAYAMGVRREVSLETEYLVTSAAASAAVDLAVRREAAQGSTLRFNLPGAYLGMEPADVLLLVHPLLTGGRAVMSVTKLAPDWARARVAGVAEELR